MERDAPTEPAGESETKLSIDEARVCLTQRMQAGLVDEADKDPIRLILREYDSMKEKVSKLKSLLGRSAKAQREAKVDLEATQKRLDQALREIERLQKKIDKLANRPTHMVSFVSRYGSIGICWRGRVGIHTHSLVIYSTGSLGGF